MSSSSESHGAWDQNIALMSSETGLPTKRLQDELRRAQQGGGCMLPPAELASVLTELIERRALETPTLAAQDGETIEPNERLKLHRKIMSMIRDKQRYAGVMIDGRELHVIAEALLERAIEVKRSTPPSQAIDAGDGEVVAWRWRVIGDNRWSVLDHEPDISDAIRDRCEVEPLFASPVAGAGEVVAWPGKCPECGCHTKADIQRADGSPDGPVRCVGCKRVFGSAHPVAPSEEVTEAEVEAAAIAIDDLWSGEDDRGPAFHDTENSYQDHVRSTARAALQTRSKQP